MKSKILFGEDEPIFSELPSNVLANLRHRGSENAVLWNLMYPLAKPRISLKSLLTLQPLWGTVNLEVVEDLLEPYFWGYSISGARLAGLDDMLGRIDGKGPRTEVDLFLLGENNLILVEAKHLGSLGRCSRYAKERCPEIHKEGGLNVEPCRYWEPGDQAFDRLLDFGGKPFPGDPSPPCNQHYQLARTLLIGDVLAKEHQLDLSLWMLVAKNRWRSTERTWLDFTDRVGEDELWRRMRVIAWEELQGMGESKGS
jgi:hypothetical protein